MIRIIPRSKWWYAMATSLVSPNVWNPPPVEHDSKSTDTTKKVVFEMMHIWKKKHLFAGILLAQCHRTSTWHRDDYGMMRSKNGKNGPMSRSFFRTILLTSIHVFWLMAYDTKYFCIYILYYHWHFFPQLGGFKPAEEYIFIDSDHDAISRENETCLQLPTSKYARYV